MRPLDNDTTWKFDLIMIIGKRQSQEEEEQEEEEWDEKIRNKFEASVIWFYDAEKEIRKKTMYCTFAYLCVS